LAELFDINRCDHMESANIRITAPSLSLTLAFDVDVRTTVRLWSLSARWE
jgi:hypothetical protein